MSDIKPFWETDHPYTSPDGNYFANRSQMEGFYLNFDSWDDFLAEMGDADDDYNYLYRWDFIPSYEDDYEPDEDDESDYTPDPPYLKFVYILQRKGNFLFAKIKNPKPEDEERIREYLEAKWAHVRRNWEPLDTLKRSSKVEPVAVEVVAAKDQPSLF